MTTTDEKLTGADLDARAAELEIEGRGSMTADEKRAAIAEAEAGSDGGNDRVSPVDDPNSPVDGEDKDVGPVDAKAAKDGDSLDAELDQEDVHVVGVVPDGSGITPVPVLDGDLSNYSSHIARDTTHLQNLGRPTLSNSDTVDETGVGARVTAVQAMLQNAGYHCQIDGAYGAQTKAAVTRFQKDNSLDETGVADDSTITKLARTLVRD